jgi:hypothetical protein
LLLLLSACTADPEPPPAADSDTDTDVDADTDTDTDVDGADSAGSGATGATGDTGPTADARIGRVYVLDLGSGVWTEPPGVGAVFGSRIGGAQLLVSPIALDASRIEWLAAPGNNSQQNLCRPTATLEQTPWYDPDFVAVGGAVVVGSADVPLTLFSSDLAGTFAPSGDTVNQVVLGGELDTRPLVEALAVGTDPDDICTVISTFGVHCEPCPDGSGDYCVRLTVEQLTGTEVPGGVVVPRTQADIDADPTCP